MAYAKGSLLTRRHKKRSYYRSIADVKRSQQAYGQASSIYQDLERQGQSLDREKGMLMGAMEDYTGRGNAPGKLDTMLSEFYGEGGHGSKLRGMYEPYTTKLGFAKNMGQTQQETGGLDPYMGDPKNIMGLLYEKGSESDKAGLTQYATAKEGKKFISGGDKHLALLALAGKSYTGTSNWSDSDWTRTRQSVIGNKDLRHEGGRWITAEEKRGKWQSAKGGFLNLSWISVWNPWHQWTEKHDIHDRVMGAASSRVKSASGYKFSSIDKSIGDVESDISNISAFKQGKGYQDFLGSYQSEYGGFKQAKSAYESFIKRGSDYDQMKTRRQKAKTQYTLAGKNLRESQMRSQTAYKDFKGMQGGVSQGMGLEYQHRQAGFGYGGTV